MNSAVSHIFEHPKWHRASRELPRIGVIICLALLGYMLAQLVWLVLTPQTELPQARSTAGVKDRASSAGIDYSSGVASLNLFGVSAQPERVAQPKTAPETRLNLKLRGVFATEDENKGLALISNGAGPEQLYLVDDKIGGSTRLAAVYPDRVMLNINGSFETLRLPETKDTGVSYVATPVQNSSNNNPSMLDGSEAPAKTLAQYRTDFLRNPSEIARLVNITQADDENGNPQGYRVTTNGQHPAFAQLGMEDGDVVTSINGITLDSSAKGLSAFQALRRARQVTVEIIRNGQPTTLNLSF